MTDLLDKTVAEIKAADISLAEARRLLVAEQAGKTRKGVIAYLQEVIAEAEKPVEPRYIVTAKGAGRIHKRQGVFYAEGDEIEGGPLSSRDDLVRRGLARLV